MKSALVVVAMMVGCGPVEPSAIPGHECKRLEVKDVCAVDGKITSCVRGCATGRMPPCDGYVWQQFPCAACRAGQPLTNCNPDAGTCSCD